jgi:nitrite reductase (NADH) large subunit
MHLLIVGNGVAGVTTAATAVKNDPSVQVEIFSEEPYLYYPRPKLWDFLSGKITLDQLYFYPLEWYAQRGITLHLGIPVGAVQPTLKTITRVDGVTVAYDRLLLANGSTPFVPPLANARLPGSFTLRSVNDALAIRRYVEAENCRTAVVIGGGILGLESARGLKDLGLQVTVLEFFPWLLPKQLDPEGATVLTHTFNDMGIATITGVVSTGIAGEARAEGVLLKDGRRIAGDLILVSAGVRPNIALAASAGLDANRGVMVNEYLESSAPDVYATGDIIEFQGHTYGIIPPAIEQARVAGANMVTPRSEQYLGTVPSNTLKVVGVDLTTVGQFTAPDATYREYRQADPDHSIYKKLVTHDNKLVGAILYGVPKAVSRISRLIRDGQPLDKSVEQLLQEI